MGIAVRRVRECERSRHVGGRHDPGRGAASPARTPVFAKTVVLAPVSGKVLIRVPGAAYSSQLTGASTVPVGTVVDTTGGRVRLTSANPQPGSVQSGQFFGGTFQIRQMRSAGGLVSLLLRDNLTRSGCARRRAGRRPPR